MPAAPLPSSSPSAPSATPSFIGQVQQLLDQLPPTERRLGEFVLSFPGDLASYTASELAAMVGVSNATVTRFIRRLGYGGYEEARRHAREASQAGSALYRSRASAGEAGPAALRQQLEQAHDNITRTFEQLAPELIAAVVQAMLAARRVCFLGTRNNHNLASYLRWQLLQALDHTELIPGPGETLGEYAAGLGPEDLLVVFDFRRSQPATRRFAELVHRAGVPVAYITDHHGPDELPAHWLLRCHTDAHGPLDSHVAAMALCHLLATGVVQQASRRGRRRLAAVEDAHERLAEL